MSFIDWSDAEDMFGAFCEFVADERANGGDMAREEFLENLLEELESLGEHIERRELDEVIAGLQTLRVAAPEGFQDDPAVTHLDACLVELERLAEDPGD